MKAILKLDWSMKGHFNTFTEVESRVNECNSDFSALKDGKPLFWLLLYLFGP